MIFAESVSITLNTVEGSCTVSIPKDVYNMISGSIDDISSALIENKVGKIDLQSVVDSVNEAYANMGDYIGVDEPFTVITNGLNGFCTSLSDTLANAQTTQNVWAESWIGHLFPGIHLGAGVNVGVSTMDISPLKDVALALGVDDLGDLPDNFVFPTITLDARLGGLVLPFDIGFTVMSVDTSSLGDVKDWIDPIYFDYFTFGFDVRYTLFERDKMKPRWSVGAGFYYTKGSVGFEDESSQASLDFNTQTVMLSTQFSAKFLCLVPFVGVRTLFSKSNVCWKVGADWANIIADESSEYYEGLEYAMSWGLLPKSFGGKGGSDFSFHPQIYGGLGIDLLVCNLTISDG